MENKLWERWPRNRNREREGEIQLLSNWSNPPFLFQEQEIPSPTNSTCDKSVQVNLEPSIPTYDPGVVVVDQSTILGLLKTNTAIESNLNTLIDSETKNISLLCAEIELIKREKEKINEKLEAIQERLNVQSELLHRSLQYLKDQEKENEDWFLT